MTSPCVVTVGPTALEFIGVVAGTGVFALMAFAFVLLVVEPTPTLLDRRASAGRAVASILAWLVPTAGCAWYLSSLIVY